MKMKAFTLILAAAALSLTSCADLGVGVDVGTTGVNPYWYGNGYIGNTYWNTPVWNYGPVYRPRPPRPPMIVNPPAQTPVPLPDAIPVPSNPGPPAPRPVNPGVNGVPIR